MHRQVGILQGQFIKKQEHPPPKKKPKQQQQKWVGMGKGVYLRAISLANRINDMCDGKY